jgi:hypothetical protein
MRGKVVQRPVRWSSFVFGLVARAAEREGVPFAQYVREAALARASFELARVEGRESLGQAFARTREQLEALGVDGAWEVFAEFVGELERLTAEGSEPA